MASYISQDLLDEIRARADIAEIISGYIPLKKAGRNFKALCPFHNEKTPSFMVSPAKQIFHCFGCGEGGNVFNFVMKYEHLEFPEAVRRIAEKVGVKIPERNLKDTKEQSLYNQLYKINEIAAEFYHLHLKNDSQAETARQYLKRRKFNEAVVNKFKLGYASGQWQALFNQLRQKGFRAELIEKAGLVIRRKDTSYYDLFRERLIFPIFNSRGKVIGFGGRTLKENKVPKYINSPETPIFKKGKNFYGLHLAKQYILANDLAIIVEGFTDCIRSHVNDIGEVVASLGTALTTEQIRILKRYTKNIILIYDADQAGQLASLRGLDLLVAEDINPRIAVLPKGFDPDRYIQDEGKDKFKKIVNEALNLFDYKLNLLRAKYDIRSPIGKVKINSEFLPTLNKINNAILKSTYTKKLAEELQVNEEDVLRELRKYKEIDYGIQLDEISKPVELKLDMAERILLNLMFEDNRLINKIKDKLSLEDFDNYYAKKIISEIYKISEDNKEVTPSKLIGRFTDKTIIQMISSIAFHTPEIKDINKNITDCVRAIKDRKIKKRLRELQAELKVAQEKKIDSRIKELSAEFTNLLNRHKDLTLKV